MAGANAQSGTWEEFEAELASTERVINRVAAVNVNASAAREAVKALIQNYFRRTRPDLFALGISAEELAPTDSAMQQLLQLANGRNPRRSYTRALRTIRSEAQRIELLREYTLGEKARADDAPAGTLISELEAKILETLKQLVPTAALSYEQAIRDLNVTDRISYRGTANELREALRETVDRLAPDSEVIAAAGFKLEKDQTHPTQRQKVRHVLRSRNISATARRTPEQSVELVEALTSQVARASYERSSLSAHVATTQREVKQLKLYVDTVLAELLQVL